MAQAFSLLIQDEKQREIKPNNQLSIESTSLNVNSSGPSPFRTNFSPSYNYSGNNRDRPMCDFCKSPGHTRYKCYKLHGYPQNGQNSARYPQNAHNSNQNFRHNRGKRMVENVQGVSIDAMTSKLDECDTQDENQNHFQLGNDGENSNNSNPTNAVNFTVVLPNGYKVMVTKIENVKLAHEITLYKVLHIPSFKFNLISVYWLSKHLRGMTSFTDNTCLLHASSLKRPLEIGKGPLEIGKVKDGLYLLCSQCLRNKSLANKTDVCSSTHSCDVNSHFMNNLHPHASPYVNRSSLSHLQSHQCPDVNNSSLNNKTHCSVSNSYIFQANDVNLLWHNRLGHVPFVKMRGISPIPVSFSSRQPFVCSIFPIARQASSKSSSFPSALYPLPLSPTVDTNTESFSEETVSDQRNACNTPNVMSLSPASSSSSSDHLPLSPASITTGSPPTQNTNIPHISNSPLTHHTPDPIPSLKRSLREHRTPVYLKDYLYFVHQPTFHRHTNNLKHSDFSRNALFSKHHHIPVNVSVHDSQSLVSSICNDSEPSSFEEATINPAWQTAMVQEFEALYSNNTWDLIPPPPGKKAIECRWVYKVKHKADGTIERFKDRLVVKGYTQQVGVDYTETFSPVVKMTTVRKLIAVVVKSG
uniref:Uncharacterized protein LOC104225398 n=2 Tax=Nicotiana sylvestris TaxID=4096 RepID=A0A1U7WLE4_NICSY|nr:PREDICTED: uncharacterized protein LOC104225398 [Nicotiana sylvestris]